MIVRITAQTPIPTDIPETGCAAFGFAELAKIASPSIPNTDQIATNANTPAQIAPQAVLPTRYVPISFLYAKSAMFITSTTPYAFEML
jgi:hypothetical protein